jgi:hypothetical protein
VGAAFAQAPVPSDETIAAMARLKFLVGSWKGDAVMTMGPGASEEVSQTEVVESRFDGLLLVVEGIGTSKRPSQAVVHHAVAMISYDLAARQYRVVAYRQDGQSIVAAAKFLENGSFQWGFDMPGRSVRYTINDTKGDWHEIGEYSADGKTWTQFLELQLKRTS